MVHKLKIIGSLTSPFTRIVRLTCNELGIDCDMDLTTFYLRNTPEQEKLVSAHNPLMKIPTLIDGDMELFESRVIVNYLLAQYGKGKEFAARFPASPAEENLISAVYGMIEAGVTWFIVKNANPEVDMNAGYMARSQERIERTLGWLENQKDLGASFGFAEAILICGLEWFRKRSIVDWSGYPALVAVHERYKDRPSVIETRIPESA